MDYSKQWFERLFKDNYPLMYRMAFSMVENADDAKDAVNQVFTQIFDAHSVSLTIYETIKQ